MSYRYFFDSNMYRYDFLYGNFGDENKNEDEKNQIDNFLSICRYYRDPTLVLLIFSEIFVSYYSFIRI
jgi:hypothetical protein